MKLVDIPTAKFPLPWGADAGAGYIRPIPVNSQIGIQDGAASLTDGYPPLTMISSLAGGVYPFGQDTNGILNQISQWVQWNNNVGGPISYDGTFATAIGGYPKGAVLASTTLGTYWLSKIDDNVDDPDSVSTNWVGYTPINLAAVDTGSANSGAITLVPAPASLAFLLYRPILVKKIATGNTLGPYQLNINGFGLKTVVHPDGTDLAALELPPSGLFTVAWNGTTLQLLSQSIDTSTSVSFSDLQAQQGNYVDDTGTINHVVAAFSPALSAYEKGIPMRVKILHTSNGAVDFNGGPGVLAVHDSSNKPLTGGMIVVGMIAEFQYNGSVIQLMNPTSTINNATSGYEIRPGGIYEQWTVGPVDPADHSEPTYTVNFLIPFPTACDFVIVTMNIATPSPNVDVAYQTCGSPTTTGVVIQRQYYPGGSVDQTTQARIWARGH